MDLRVSQALGIAPLTGARVLAGKQGLDRSIRSVTIMDTPDIKNWLKGGELLLANVFVIKDDPAAQVALVQDLFDRGVAALGVKLKRFVPGLPEEMLELADRLGLPVIEMPVDCAWIEILNPVLTAILNRQAQALEQSSRIHDQFTTVALQGHGMPDICANLSRLTHSPCAVFDLLGHLVDSAAPPVGETSESPIDWPKLLALVTAHADRRSGGISMIEHDGGQLLISSALLAGNDNYGSFALLLQPGVVRELALTALEHAGTVATLEMVRRRAVLETERRFRNDFLVDLLNGNVETREAVLSRAWSLGNWDFSRSHQPMIVDMDLFEQFHLMHQNDPEKIKHAIEVFTDVVTTVSRTIDPFAVAVEQSDSVTVLFPAAADCEGERFHRENSKGIAETLRRRVGAKFKDMTASIGIGRLYSDVLDWTRSYREARLALTYGRRVWGRNRVFHYDDLGTYRVLLGNPNIRDMQAFAADVLSGLDDCDEPRRGELTRTLEAYFRCNRHARATAEMLFVHVNTVRHRIGRLKQILGFDPESPEDCLNVELALRIRTCLKESRS